MNRRFSIFYKTSSTLRLVGTIILLVILFVDVANSPPPADDGEGGISLYFSFWELLFMYSLVIVYPVNSIINALIAFKPKWTLPGIFDWKPLFILFYVVELLLFPYFSYLAWEQVQDAFFPPPPDTYLGVVLDFLSTERDRSDEKLGALCFSFFVLCSLLFLIFFWRVYKVRKGQTYNV